MGKNLCIYVVVDKFIKKSNQAIFLLANNETEAIQSTHVWKITHYHFVNFFLVENIEETCATCDSPWS